MSVSKKQIDQALLDVRKSYRLLHDYQRTALDAANYIGAQLDLTYRGGYPLFSNCAPRGGKGDLKDSAWDWLNHVFYDFHFTKRIGEKDFNLSIWLFSDTGYFMSKDPESVKTAVAAFAPVETSETKIGFLLYRDWKEEYDQFRQTRDAVREFLAKGKLPASLAKAGVLGMCCDFGRFANEVSTDEVIAELVQLAKANSFPLERKRKTF